jgi:hypothetical protein
MLTVLMADAAEEKVNTIAADKIITFAVFIIILL